MFPSPFGASGLESGVGTGAGLACIGFHPLSGQVVWKEKCRGTSIDF